MYSYSNQVIPSHLWVISRNIYLDWLPCFLHFSIKGASTFDLWLSERKRQIMEPCFIGAGVEGRWQRKHLDETGWLSAQDGQARQLDRQASRQAGRLSRESGPEMFCFMESNKGRINRKKEDDRLKSISVAEDSGRELTVNSCGRCREEGVEQIQ